ncbi:MAG TPA: hypothetical protein V6D14_05615 [Coleofasciculaceae cyanobacterium]
MASRTVLDRSHVLPDYIKFGGAHTLPNYVPQTHSTTVTRAPTGFIPKSSGKF